MRRWYKAHDKKGESHWEGYNMLKDFVKVLEKPKTCNPVKKMKGGKFVLRLDDEFLHNN
jgi:hypothetical protein